MLSINDYVGAYTVTQGSGSGAGGFAMQDGDRIYVGVPAKNASGVSGDTVGMTVWRNEVQVFPMIEDIAASTTNALMTFSGDSNVYWNGELGGEPYWIQFTLVVIGDWKVLYGAVIQTDPEVVGAWGADDRP